MFSVVHKFTVKILETISIGKRPGAMIYCKKYAEVSL